MVLVMYIHLSEKAKITVLFCYYATDIALISWSILLVFRY